MNSSGGRTNNPHPLESYADPQRLQLIFYWFIALIILGFVIGFFIVFTANTPGTNFALASIAVGALPILASVYFVHRQKFEWAAVLMSITLIILITVLATNSLGIHHITNLSYPVILIIASLVMRKRTMIVLTLVTVGCAAWLVFGELTGAYTPAPLVHSVPGDFFTVSMIIILTAVMVRLITESLFRANRRLQEELVERKLAEEKIHQQAARAEALGALSQVLTRISRDYQLVLDTVVQRCAELIGDGASIFLYSPGQEFLELAAVYNPDPKAVEIFRAEMQARPIRVDEGAYPKAIREKQSVLIESIPFDLLIERAPSAERREYYRKLPIYSMMLVPLLVHGEVLGCLGLGRHAPGKNYSTEDLTFLQDIADRSALAVFNAQIHKMLEQDLAERRQYEQQLQQRFQELAAIHAVSQAAASVLEFDSLFGLVSDELFKLFDIHEVYFALHDRQAGEVQFPYYRHGDQRIETGPVPFGQGLSSRVIMTRQPLLIDEDYQRRSVELGVVKFSSSDDDIDQASWLGVPIRTGEQVIGMICVMNLQREHAFSPTDVVLLTTLAANVGIAIQNAQLYMEAQQEIAERKQAEINLRKRESILEAITFSAEQFLKQSHWSNSVNEVLERLGRELNASHAYLFEYHLGENGTTASSLRYEWAAPGMVSNLKDPDFQNMYERETEFDRYYGILDRGEPYVGSSSFFIESEKEYFNSVGIKALLEMRIIVDGRHWGTLGFDDMVNEREWTTVEVDMIKVAVNVLGSAIKRLLDEDALKHELAERTRAENALQKSTSRLELLHDIDRALLSVQSPAQIANEALSRIRRLIPSQRVSITLFNFETNEARIVAASFDVNFLPYGGPVVTLDKYGQYIINELLKNKPLRVDDIFADSRAIELDEVLAQIGLRSWLYLPLFSQGKLIGALNLARTGENPFTDEEEAIGYEVANQLAIVLQQNQLLDALQAELNERKRMQDILFEEKERAEVTLYSIGDAVITTDEQTRIIYLNPVAENLLGWKMPEVAGQPLRSIFRIVEEVTRKPVPNPVERCLRENRIIGLANHSILISRDGVEYAIDDSAAPIRNRQGETIGVVLVFHDVTEERRLSQQIAHDAMHDSLTGLINRREFERRLEHALNSVKEHGLSHILCYLDLDQFKIVNDTAGHAAGDEMLKQISRLLGGVFRQRDTFARLGGDEFGLLLENCQLEQALVISNEIMSKFREYTFSWAGQSFQAGVSIGVVSIDANTESVAQLLSQADIACYSAKDFGRGRIHVYETGDSETTRRYNEIVQASRLRDAILKNQFRLYCQPISNLAEESSHWAHYEVLLRMVDTDGNLVMPSVFIPPAERYGLMPAIDRWVIHAALMAMSQHDTRGLQMAINISGTSLGDDNLLEYVLEQIREFSIQPEQICFEITETAAIHHLSKAKQFIQRFKERGGKIALDDFGSGFSSFRYLKSLPVDYMKIDGSFVSGMLSNPSDQAMVEAITQVAHTLGIEVVAEYATNQDTIKRLREMGVENAQGFGIGLPMPIEEIWQDKNSAKTWPHIE